MLLTNLGRLRGVRYRDRLENFRMCFLCACSQWGVMTDIGNRSRRDAEVAETRRIQTSAVQTCAVHSAKLLSYPRWGLENARNESKKHAESVSRAGMCVRRAVLRVPATSASSHATLFVGQETVSISATFVTSREKNRTSVSGKNVTQARAQFVGSRNVVQSGTVSARPNERSLLVAPALLLPFVPVYAGTTQ